MDEDQRPTLSWNRHGKTIAELIKELQSFDDKELVVEISVDAGSNRFPISLVGKSEGHCVIMFIE
jgi:hypothetical protein